MKKLQVFKSNTWQYVFCHNPQTGIVTTKDKKRALPPSAIWAKDDLAYFSNKYGSSQFRLGD